MRTPSKPAAGRKRTQALPPAVEPAARVHPAVVVSLLLGVFALACVLSMRQKGSTFDESAHLPAGYSYLVTGDFRMNPDHPPLVKIIAALPLLLADIKFSPNWPEWREGHQFPFGSRFLFDENDASSVLFLARLPMVAIGCLLGLLIWFWAREIGGRVAAHLSLLLFVLTPDFLAHSQLVTTDVAATASMLASAYLFWRTLRRWTVTSAVLSGVALGAVLSAKFNGVVIVPVLAAYGLLRVISKKPWPYRRWFGSAQAECDTYGSRLWLLAVTAAFCILMSLLTIWISYGCRYAQPISSDGRYFYDWKSKEMPGSTMAATVRAARAAHLIPEPWAYGFLYALKSSQNRVAFLNGERSSTGWWYYFIETFFVKTPIPEILVILVALATLCVGSQRSPSHVAVVLPAVVYMGVALTSNLNIGHRHLLPIYPFLIVLAGDALSRLLRRGRPALLAASAVLVWQAFEVVSIHPHYLAYFNELAGGPTQGWRLLVDSNIDWGQDLPGLKRWMDERGVRTLKLSYFGTGVPEYYGIDYEALPSFFPLRRERAGKVSIAAGDIVAISATNLPGVYFWGPKYRDFNEFLRSLRDRASPVETIGYSIFIFRMPVASSVDVPSRQLGP